MEEPMIRALLIALCFSASAEWEPKPQEKEE